MRDYPAGLLHRHYLVVLVLVAFLVLLNQVLVQPSLLHLTTDAPVINVAGRQRMLSQRLAKAALALDGAEDEVHRRRHLAELGRVLRLWSASHNGLRHGDRRLSLPGRNSKAIREAFDDLEPFFTRMRDAVARLIADEPSGGPTTPRPVRTSRPSWKPRASIWPGWTGSSDSYERETRARVDRLLWTGWAVTALILVALAGDRPVHPAARGRGSSRRQIVELREARDELEDRVRDRTRELELANEQLAREARERGLAEERHRALLEQFSHVARTTTIGEMASGLAHELNQPLGAIANYAEGCLVELDSPRPALDEVRIALEKVLATTTPGRRDHPTDSPVRDPPRNRRRNSSSRIGSSRRSRSSSGTRRGGGESHSRSELAPELPTLWGDPVQIQQVLVNLVRNAFEALAASEPIDPTGRYANSEGSIRATSSSA